MNIGKAIEKLSGSVTNTCLAIIYVMPGSNSVRRKIEQVTSCVSFGWPKLCGEKLGRLYTLANFNH